MDSRKSKRTQAEWTRRAFVKSIALGTGTLYLRGSSGPLAAFMAAPPVEPKLFSAFSPIDRSVGDVAERQFFGDDMSRGHSLLRDGTAPAVPPVSETTDVVVIGGGIGGLFSTYLLRGHQPILLEQAGRFGGVSQGQAWRGNDFALGAAYFCFAEEDDPRQKLYAELGLDRIYRLKEEEDPVLYSGSIYKNFWSGETAPAGRRDQFTKLGDYFRSVYNEENDQRYPEIPFDAGLDADLARYVADLDTMSFRQLAEKVAGGPLHPHIETALQHYCWSSMGATVDEISAAGGLNFYAAEFGGLYVTPGGNAGAAELVLKRIAETVPDANLRAGSVVFQVNVVSDGVLVSYVGPGGAKTIKAKAVVMGCPKYVAKHILRDIEPDRLEAIDRLNYRAYLVANVLLKGGLKESFYDMYMLQDGRMDPKKTIEASATAHGFQDTLNGVYAHPDPEHTVLTLYQGLPFDGARATLENDGSYDALRANFENQVDAQVLPVLGFKKSDIVDTRVARWGHAIPVSAVGLIANGVVDRLRKPFRERVFFVNQDNWALPAFETSLGEAMNWKDAVDIAVRTG